MGVTGGASRVSRSAEAVKQEFLAKFGRNSSQSAACGAVRLGDLQNRVPILFQRCSKPGYCANFGSATNRNKMNGMAASPYVEAAMYARL